MISLFMKIPRFLLSDSEIEINHYEGTSWPFCVVDSLNVITDPIVKNSTSFVQREALKTEVALGIIQRIESLVSMLEDLTSK